MEAEGNFFGVSDVSQQHGGKVVRLSHRIVSIRSGVELASRMLRSEAMVRPVAMHRVVAEAMTIKETSFFRDYLPFEILAEVLLPEVIRRRERVRRLRLWSAGCATGQEAYSLAMMICDRFPELESWDVQIVGTDISRSACAYAQRGRYSRLAMNRGLPARLMVRYFERSGDEWTVRPEVKRLVRFEHGDLRESAEGRVPCFDVALLRNVLPYFHGRERMEVLAETYARLESDAVLLVGNSEQIEDAPELFAMEFAREQAFYRAVILR
jgi:chemotaxis protein methyltransferase CheR